jgi:glycosyltransferase involved in cell wall biosynthesis
MTPLVTVGIPFYNEQEVLVDAIRSVFAQTLTVWELILVDDGSTDGSLEIASSVADSRVRVVSDGRNLGLSARLNQIALLAKGAYLARMDADDFMHPDRLSAQVQYLADNPGVDVVGTGMFILVSDDQPVDKRLPPTHPMSAMTALSRGCFLHASVMGRKEWFARYPYDSEYDGAEDRELWSRAFGWSTFANLKGCYYYYREHRSFSLARYARASSLVARIYRKNGPGLVGTASAYYLWLRERAKVAVYAAATGFHLQRHLVRKRSTPLTATERRDAIEGLARIRSTTLPTRREAAERPPEASSA